MVVGVLLVGGFLLWTAERAGLLGSIGRLIRTYLCVALVVAIGACEEAPAESSPCDGLRFGDCYDNAECGWSTDPDVDLEAGECVPADMAFDAGQDDDDSMDVPLDCEPAWFCHFEQCEADDDECHALCEQEHDPGDACGEICFEDYGTCETEPGGVPCSPGACF